MERMFFKQKKDILDSVYSVSNDVMINCLIEDLINHDGVTNFFWNNSGCVMLTDKSEYVQMIINSNNLHLISNCDNSYREINYVVCSDDSRAASYNLYDKVEWPDYTENRTLECSRRYDSNGKLVFSEKVKTSYLSSSDNDLKQSLRKTGYENYRVVTSDYSLGDKMLRVSSSEYFHDSSMNDVKYFIGAPTDCGLMKYYPISYEKFAQLYSGVVTDCVQKMKILK